MSAIVAIVIDAPRARLDAAVEAAYALGVQGLELRDEEVGAPPGRAIVRLWLPEGREAKRAVERLRAALGDAVSISIETGQSGWSPKCRALGRGFVVVPEGATIGTRWRTRTPLHVDASTAFGDGAHPTTTLCVAAIEAWPARRLRSARVLDVGTGTGVLAIVAALRGAREVVATDDDPLARRAARVAVRRHELGDRIAVRASMPRDRFEWVVANLYRDLLIAEAPRIARRVADGGTLVVSGFAARSIPEISARFEALGLESAGRARRGGWGALTLVRRG